MSAVKHLRRIEQHISFVFLALLTVISTSGSLQAADAQTEAQTVSPMRFGTPIKAPFIENAQDNPVDVEFTTPKIGRLVYTFTNRNSHTGDDQSYLVVHDSRALDEIQGVIQKQAVLFYPVQKSPQFSKYYEVFTPMLSPDRRYILFKFGDIWKQHEMYWLYVLDTQTNKLSLVSNKRLAYNFVSWSPDSNYIAFIEGGDSSGNTVEYTAEQNVYFGPLKLYVCDWRKEKSYLVASNDTLSGPFSWFAPHTLLYGALSTEGQKVLEEQKLKRWQDQEKVDNKTPVTQPQQTAIIPRPDVYEYSVEEESSKLIIKDGYHPTPSPDGKWIAFYGSEDTQKPVPLRVGWQNDAQGSALLLARRDGTGRVALTQETGIYPLIRWRLDNTSLLTVQPVKNSPDAEAEVKEWDVETQRFRAIATLKAHDYKASKISFVSPKFLPVEVTETPASLYVFVSERVSQYPGIALSVILQTLYLIDLSKGTVTSVAKIKGATGVDWQSDLLSASFSTP